MKRPRKATEKKRHCEPPEQQQQLEQQQQSEQQSEQQLEQLEQEQPEQQEQLSKSKAKRCKIPKKPRKNLPKEATAYLRGWLYENRHYPYPTEDEKRALANATKLSYATIINWFINARRRNLPTMLLEEGLDPADFTLHRRGGSGRDSKLSLYERAAIIFLTRNQLYSVEDFRAMRMLADVSVHIAAEEEKERKRLERLASRNKPTETKQVEKMDQTPPPEDSQQVMEPSNVQHLMEMAMSVSGPDVPSGTVSVPLTSSASFSVPAPVLLSAASISPLSVKKVIVCHLEKDQPQVISTIVPVSTIVLQPNPQKPAAAQATTIAPSTSVMSSVSTPPTTRPASIFVATTRPVSVTPPVSLPHTSSSVPATVSPPSRVMHHLPSPNPSSNSVTVPCPLLPSFAVPTPIPCASAQASSAASSSVSCTSTVTPRLDFASQHKAPQQPSSLSSTGTSSGVDSSSQNSASVHSANAWSMVTRQTSSLQDVKTPVVWGPLRTVVKL